MSDQGSGSGLSRREVIRRGGAAAVAVSGANLLAACGGSSSSSASPSSQSTSTSSAAGPPAGGTPVRGGTLTVGWIGAGQEETLIPGHALANVDIWRVQQLFDGLYYLGPDATPVPGLAESAQRNADGTIWTVNLRSGVTWHDGKPLTADDVAVSIKTWASTNNFGSALATKLIEPSAVRARGPLTVEVPLKIALADFPGVVSFYNYYITRPDIYNKGAIPIGTGPFKYQSFTPGQRSVFAANQDYWGGAPYMDQQVVDSTFTDDTARINALLAGAIDIAPQIPPALAKAYAGTGQIYVGHALGANPYYFQCRVDLDPFKDLRVMLALKLLCDRPQMIESVFSGYAAESNDLEGPGLPYYAGPDIFPIRKYDPEQAKSLLKAAGREDLTLTLLTTNLYAGWVEGATAYAAQAAAAGVKVKVQTVDPSIYYTTQGPDGGYLSYPMFTELTGGASSDPSLTSVYLTDVWSKGPYNETHFGNAQTDRLLFEAVGETDISKAQEKWNAIQQVQYEQGGSITFGIAEYVDGYGKNVRGVRTTPGGWVNNNNVRTAWLTA